MGIVAGPRVAIPSFSNQYSMDFDGVDDYINIGTQSLGITSAISVSVWVKIPTTNTGGGGTNYQEVVCEDAGGGTSRNWALNWRGGTTNNISFVIFHTDGSITGVSSTGVVPNDGNWHHLLGTYGGTTSLNGLKLFVDGNIFQATAVSSGVRSTSTVNPVIGALQAGSAWKFEGNIDEVSIFNSDQSSNISDIYNNGIPTDLTSLNPLVWYRMGDSGVFRDPQWLLPSNENKDKVSNYSMAFDGVDDYINLGTDSSLDIFGGDFTISLWAKWGAQTTNSNGIVSFGANSDKAMVGLGFSTNYGKITFATPNLTPNGALYDMGSGYDDNQWHNIICTFSGNSLSTYFRSVYVDGVDITSTSLTSNLDVGINNDIGVRDRGNQNRYFTGNIDDVSLFNRVVTNSERSILSTEPSDLTSLNPVSWYRMADNSTFSTNWTVPDEVGSNDGTSANMTLSDRIGDAPNSINNALSLNMDEVDRETDVPT